jgi:hypothetical protein
MFGRERARRRRARKESERVLAEARAAASAARQSAHLSQGVDRGRPIDEDELAEAIQSAILGSVRPYLNDASTRRAGTDRDRPHSSGALALLIGVGIGVGVAAWARRTEGTSDEPLPEDEEWELVNGPSTRIIKSAINDTLDKADVVIRRLAKTVAETMGAAVSTVADAAGPTAELVTDKLRLARERATSGVIRTLDDLDAVWDDEGSASEAPADKPAAKKPTPKKPTPRKPVVGKPKASKPASSASSSPKKTRSPQSTQGKEKKKPA